MRIVTESPPLVVHPVRQRRLPVAATNDRGWDLLPLLRDLDDRCTDDIPPGGRRGVRPPHDLILDLGSVPDPDDLRLFLNGWVYPANTSTHIATSQSPDSLVIPPKLFVADGRGGWVDSGIDVGIPAGKRKTMVFDLSGRFPARDYRVKLTTTMELYWDAAWYVSGEPRPPTRLHRVPLASATLGYHGFSRPVALGPHSPLYRFEYEAPVQAPVYRLVPGRYTRYGDVTELVRAVDDRSVIFGAGEEVRLFFEGRALPPPPPGWTRTWVLSTDGWTKDHDPNTLTADRVEPLPFHGMRAYPYRRGERFPLTPAHRRWLREYQTREVRDPPGAMTLRDFVRARSE